MTDPGLLRLVLMGALVGCGSDPGSPTSPQDRLSALKEQVQDLYEQARESGQRVPKDALEWARQDLLRIGDWEYKIVDVPEESDESRQARFNELGAERWEVFWIEPAPGGIRVYLKRRSRSFLERIPLSDLRRLLSFDSGSSE